MFRPTRKELSNKLREAKVAVQNHSVFLIDQDVIAEDAIELGFDIADELLEVRSHHEKTAMPQMLQPDGASNITEKEIISRR